MTLVIGTDEAGYGPNLGPLVVAASVWRVAAPPRDAEDVLARGIEGAADEAGPLWSDSKQVYRGGSGRESGLTALESGVLTAVAMATGRVPAAWTEFSTAAGVVDQTTAPPPEWSILGNLALPRAADPHGCGDRAVRVAGALARAGVILDRTACRVVHPREFNALLATGLNKSDILSQITLGLAAEARATARDEPALIWCDRHGGRKHYAPVLSQHFDCPLVRPIEETAERSVYELPTNGSRVEFCVGGERRGPVALASMLAKYVRELAMLAFNGLWSERCPGLGPTAGYPVDAARWRRDAAAAVRSSGLADDDLWRRA
jgi:hypothetical protein